MNNNQKLDKYDLEKEYLKARIEKANKIADKLYELHATIPQRNTKTGNKVLWGIEDRGVVVNIIGFALDRTQTNLCDTCEHHIATCHIHDAPEFGEGIGKDNVLKCEEHKDSRLSKSYKFIP